VNLTKTYCKNFCKCCHVPPYNNNTIIIFFKKNANRSLIHNSLKLEIAQVCSNRSKGKHWFIDPIKSDSAVRKYRYVQHHESTSKHTAEQKPGTAVHVVLFCLRGILGQVKLTYDGEIGTMAGQGEGRQGRGPGDGLLYILMRMWFTWGIHIDQN
jgi:hypothetical protein